MSEKDLQIIAEYLKEDEITNLDNLLSFYIIGKIVKLMNIKMSKFAMKSRTKALDKHTFLM